MSAPGWPGPPERARHHLAGRRRGEDLDQRRVAPRRRRGRRHPPSRHRLGGGLPHRDGSPALSGADPETAISAPRPPSWGCR